MIGHSPSTKSARTVNTRQMGNEDERTYTYDHPSLGRDYRLQFIYISFNRFLGLVDIVVLL
jgi:hypothetical protein